MYSIELIRSILNMLYILGNSIVISTMLVMIINVFINNCQEGLTMMKYLAIMILTGMFLTLPFVI